MRTGCSVRASPARWSASTATTRWLKTPKKRKRRPSRPTAAQQASATHRNAPHGRRQRCRRSIISAQATIGARRRQARASMNSVFRTAYPRRRRRKSRRATTVRLQAGPGIRFFGWPTARCGSSLSLAASRFIATGHASVFARALSVPTGCPSRAWAKPCALRGSNSGAAAQDPDRPRPTAAMCVMPGIDRTL